MGQQQRGEETRSRILDAAAERFAQHGYEATSVMEICQRAGVTKGAFYHHFPSKQTVFLELLNRWLLGLDERLAEARAKAASVPEGILRMADQAQHVFKMADGQLAMFLEFWVEAGHDPAIWQATIAPYRRYRDFFSNIVQAGIAEGTLRQVDPEMAAQVIVSLAAGLVLQGVFDPKGADWGQVAHQAIWQATIAPYRRYRDFFSSIVQAGIAEGTLRQVDPEMAAQVIVSLAAGLVLQGVFDPKGADWGLVAHEAIQMLLDGLERKRA